MEFISSFHHIFSAERSNFYSGWIADDHTKSNGARDHNGMKNLFDDGLDYTVLAYICYLDFLLP